MNRLAVLAAALMGFGVAGGIVLGKYIDRTDDPAAETRSAPEIPEALASLQTSYRDAAQYVMPSVVHITTSRTRRRRTSDASVGSGVIVSADGFVLTNAHVIEEAGRSQRSKLSVRTYDGGQYDADIVGTDTLSDIAVIKIQGGGPFTPANLGDSDQVRLGDLVLAIGSPFELNHSVTHGIISAVSRKLRGSRSIYDEYLQTDAAINPGNSGGALINLRGEVIGINTRILSRTGSGVGIGFAIPSNLAEWVQTRLIERGKIERGYIGIEPRTIDEELARDLSGSDINSLSELLSELGLKEAEGAFVLSVRRGFPAEEAGMKVGDVILEFAVKGQPMQKVHTSADVWFKVADTPPGTTITMTVMRDRQTLQIELVLVEPPDR